MGEVFNMGLCESRTPQEETAYQTIMGLMKTYFEAKGAAGEDNHVDLKEMNDEGKSTPVMYLQKFLEIKNFLAEDCERSWPDLERVAPDLKYTQVKRGADDVYQAMVDLFIHKKYSEIDGRITSFKTVGNCGFLL